MSAIMGEEEEEPQLGGGKGPIRPKPRFSVNEVRVLLQAVRKNRYVILKRFNQGVSVELKKQTWADITNQVNELGENYREVRQIMKKWADLKCDGKRRMASMRGPNGSHLRKKTLGPVEMMVHKILTMNADSEENWDVDFEEEEDLYKLYHSTSYSYLNNTDNVFLKGAFDLSPQSEQSKDPQHSSSDIEPFDDGDYSMDMDDEDSFTFPLPSSSSADVVPDVVPDVIPDRGLLRIRPLLTYSRNTQNQNQSQTPSEEQQGFSKPPSGPSSPPVASTSEAASTSSSSSQAPPLPPSPEAEPLPAPSPLPKQAPPPPLYAPPPPSEQPSTSAQLAPFPLQLAFLPAQSAPLPSQSAPFPAQLALLPPQSTPFLPQSAPLPPQSAPLPAQSTPLPAQSAPLPAQSAPLPPQLAPLPAQLDPLPRSSNPLPRSSNPLPAQLDPLPPPSDPLPVGFRGGPGPAQLVAQMASQSVAQQAASRALLSSVSQSLETLAQSVQLLVEGQTEFVQESLLMQRETLDIIKDFSSTALAMLRGGGAGSGASGMMAPRQHPNF